MALFSISEEKESRELLSTGNEANELSSTKINKRILLHNTTEPIWGL